MTWLGGRGPDGTLPNRFCHVEILEPYLLRRPSLTESHLYKPQPKLQDPCHAAANSMHYTIVATHKLYTSDPSLGNPAKTLNPGEPHTYILMPKHPAHTCTHPLARKTSTETIKSHELSDRNSRTLLHIAERKTPLNPRATTRYHKSIKTKPHTRTHAHAHTHTHTHLYTSHPYLDGCCLC